MLNNHYVAPWRIDVGSWLVHITDHLGNGIRKIAAPLKFDGHHHKTKAGAKYFGAGRECELWLIHSWRQQPFLSIH